ncbi:uncharacterized protein FPRO_06996 [Fusarium proliferatum ET1]|uniref:Uncharacterized protein n=1 Tax=Fusarium proliferatum (strain ET1) TaxID=1227346 RepID=A0A1L7VAQ4_FUSPR|nr:uncharacterized protein FPRO_06996 [Fusarium proliferatum ET1]CZR37813.1 uncharacterized protein FPRO_06996 [Fusarium proliferatum ET1]
MYTNLISQGILVLGSLGYVAATNPGCVHPCIQLPQGHHEPWLCPVGIPRPHYHIGKWPTLEEENLAKALIGPVTKQDPCGWQSDGKLCRASQNAHVTLSLVSSDPLTVKVKISNHDAYPITFWTRYSPLSQHAFDYEYFTITPLGHHSVAAKAQAPTPAGYRPETAPELSVISPGEALEADIVLTNPNHFFHKMVKDGGDIEIGMSGRWNGFWAATAPEVMNSDLGYSCNNIWSSLGLTWSAQNKLLLRFPKQHYVSSEPSYSVPKHGAEPETSAGNEPTYGDKSSRVGSDVADETEKSSSIEQSESTSPKDDAKPVSGQLATESPAAKSPAGESLPTESPGSAIPEDPASEEPGSNSASQCVTEKVATTPAPAEYGRTEEGLKLTTATQSWKTMASTTTQPGSARLEKRDCCPPPPDCPHCDGKGPYKEGCECKAD